MCACYQVSLPIFLLLRWRRERQTTIELEMTAVPAESDDEEAETKRDTHQEGRKDVGEEARLAAASP